MQKSGLMIDILHSQLLELAKDPKFNFGPLRCDWGRANSEKYNLLYVQFCRTIRELAKSCPVKYYLRNFYMFNGKIYEVVDVSVVEQAYQLLIEDLYIAPMLGRTGIRRDNFVDVIRQYNILSPQFDIVAFANGVVDFGSGVKEPMVMPFSPEYHVTYFHPYDYNPKAKCNKWLNFIHEVLPDQTSRLILQMFLGLGLTQRGTAYSASEGTESSKIELCLLLVGAGANGKSVIFDVACNLFGRDRISKMDYADLTADGDEGMRGRFPIKNAIFNWSSDSDPKKFGRKNTGIFKRIVSGEAVPMRELGKNVTELDTLPYLIFNLNELPFPEDASLGFIRRLQYISFDVSIPKERQDPNLAAKIVRTEMSGVFNWVFRGMMELRKRKFQFPAAEGSVRQLLLSLMDSAPVSAWTRAYGIRPEPEAKKEQPIWMLASKMYECFRQFCLDNNMDEEDIPSQQKFGHRMRSCRFMKTRKPSGFMYRTYGISEVELNEHIIINNVAAGEEDEKEVETFIKEDD